MTDPEKLFTLLAILFIVSVIARNCRTINAAQEPMLLKAQGHPVHSQLVCGRAYFNKTLTLGTFGQKTSLTNHSGLEKVAHGCAMRRIPS